MSDCRAMMHEADLQKGSKHAVFRTAKTMLKRMSNDISKEAQNHNLIVNTEGYRSGHNEAVLKICEHCRRKKVKKPCKHWLFGHFRNITKAHF